MLPAPWSSEVLISIRNRIWIFLSLSDERWIKTCFDVQWTLRWKDV